MSDRGAAEIHRGTGDCVEIPQRAFNGVDATRRSLNDSILLANASFLADVGHWDLDLLTGYLDWSDTTCRLFGIDPHDFTHSLEQLLSLILPEDQTEVDATRLRRPSSDGVITAEYRIRRPDGAIRWMQERGFVEMNKAGSVTRKFGCVIDITPRKVAEEKSQRLMQVYALLSAISAMILRAADDQALFVAACRIAVDTGHFRAAWIGLVDADGASARAVASSGGIEQYLTRIKVTTDLTATGRGPFGTAIRENRVVVCNDISTDPYFGPWRDTAKALGLKSAAVFPLRRDGCVIGGFALYSGSDDFFDSDERNLLQRLADDMSIAIELRDKEQARRQAEVARRDTEEHMRAVFEQAGLGICVISRDYRFSRVNEQFCQIVGYSMQELLDAHTCIDTTHVDDRDGDAEAVSQLLDGASSVTRTKRYVHKTHRPVWAQLTLSALRDETGEVTGFIGIIQDISTQKRAMEDRDRFFNLSRDMLSIRDFNGIFLQVNPAWTVCLGWQRDELLGRPSLELVHPDDVERSVAARRQLLEGSSTRDFESRYRCKDGSYRWISWNSRPVHDAGQIVSSARDVTERRMRESQLLLLETCLARMNDIVIITEANVPPDDPRIVFVNNAFVERTGFAREHVIGRTQQMLHGPKTDRDELSRISAMLAQRLPVRTTLVNYSKSGKELLLEMDVVPVIDTDNQCTHFVSVQRDITQRIALEERVRQAERMEAVGQLTGGLAHDFNNLLGVIIGNAELLCEELSPAAPQRELAEAIGRASQRGALLTKRLLAFSRRQTLDSRAANVNGIVAGLRPLLAPMLGGNIELNYALATQPCIAMVDLGQLENALLNLCINARDAMPDGGKLTIETQELEFDAAFASHQPDVVMGRYVMVAVSDTGKGICPTLIGRVFEPFFTTKAPGQGTGMGLAMVFGFVKQSGGHLSIDSKPQHGTTVKMYFPLASPFVMVADVAPLEPDARGGSESILLVEDDEELRRFAVKQVSALGYRVTEVADAREAMAVLQRAEPIDLLFTDVLIPGGMNGRELAKAAIRLRPELKVLYTSAYPANALVSQGRLDDSMILLQKPYKRRDLAQYLRRVINLEPK